MSKGWMCEKHFAAVYFFALPKSTCHHFSASFGVAQHSVKLELPAAFSGIKV